MNAPPSLLVFHPDQWDPARAEQVKAYSRTVTPILIPSSSPAAVRYGVAGRSAVIVVDGSGEVVWRHVSGAHALPNPAQIDAALGAAIDAPTSDRSGWSRREFVGTVLAAAFALAIEPGLTRAEATAMATTHAAPGAARPVALHVNGRDITLTLEPRVTLLDALREYAGLTGSKKGCDHGQCGACTVHIDGRRVLSCLTLAMSAQGKQVTTIEGLDDPMQQAFVSHDGFQCGYCTPGQIMSATAVVHEPWGPTDDDVREAMSGNICRCGAYVGIVGAIQQVRQGGGPR
jgi:xanthine dehydrogenase YagT iron-sulfur-binding subunit